MIARVHMCITAVKLTADKSLNEIESDFQNHQGVVTHIHMLAKNLSITVGSAGFQCLQICLVDLLENDWFSGDKDKQTFCVQL